MSESVAVPVELPATFCSRMDFPQDDFILVYTDAPETVKFMSALMHGINAIVDGYGGNLDELRHYRVRPYSVRGVVFDQKRSH